MKKDNKEVAKARKITNNRDIGASMKISGQDRQKVNKNMVTNLVKKTIRMIDRIKVER